MRADSCAAAPKRTRPGTPAQRVERLQRLPPDVLGAPGVECDRRIARSGTTGSRRARPGTGDGRQGQHRPPALLEVPAVRPVGDGAGSAMSRSSWSTWFSWTVTSSAVRPWNQSEPWDRSNDSSTTDHAACPGSCRRCRRRSAADPRDTRCGSGCGRRAAASSRSLIERYGSGVNERLPRVSAQKKLRFITACVAIAEERRPRRCRGT